MNKCGKVEDMENQDQPEQPIPIDQGLVAALTKAATEAATAATNLMMSKQQKVLDDMRAEMEIKRKHDNVKFKKIGNEQQYLHSKAVLEKINDSVSNLEQLDVAAAKETLEEGKKILLKGMKLIS